MYNRYIPQPDGTYRRNAMLDAAREPPRPIARQEEPVCQDAVRAPETINSTCQNCVHAAPQRRQAQLTSPRRNSPPVSVGNFLRRLLPKDFDTEDLIIVLLLLLMAGDQEEQNSALLTLVLYLFL